MLENCVQFSVGDLGFCNVLNLWDFVVFRGLLGQLTVTGLVGAFYLTLSSILLAPLLTVVFPIEEGYLTIFIWWEPYSG